MRSNVIKMTIPPRTTKKRYRNQDVTLTYDRDTGLTRWDVDKTVKINLNGTADTEARAFEEAKVAIDKMEK